MTPLAGRIAETVQAMLKAEDSSNTIVFMFAATKVDEEGNCGMVIKGTIPDLSELVRVAKKNPETGTVVKAVILSNTFA